MKLGEKSTGSNNSSLSVGSNMASVRGQSLRRLLVGKMLR